RMTLFDANGHVVMDAYARTYRSISAAKFLTTGKYTLRVTGLTHIADASLPTMAFTIRGMNLSDPIGPQGSDPDSPSVYDYEWQEHDDAYYSLNSYDDVPGVS